VSRLDPARLALPAALLGTGGILVTAAGFAVDRAAAVHGWLFALLFFLGLSLGATALRAIHGLTGGTWGVALAVPLRAMAALMPLPALGFLPILLSLDGLFPWRDLPTTDPLVAAKLAYMATPFIVMRLVACLAAFLGAGVLAGVWSGAVPSPRRSVITLILWSLGLLFFTTDWMVAPDPRFYSTIYPVLEAGAEMLAALALAILIATLALPFANPVTGEEHGTRLSEDLANLLFGFLLLLIYLAFMQWLVVWSGDLPEEIGWYLARASNGRAFLLILAVLLATLSLMGFLYRPLKRTTTGIAVLAGTVLVAALLDAFWRLRGGFPGPLLAWPDVSAFLGMGGLWTAGCARALGRRPLPRTATHG
jgi:hypothetical protein